MESQNVTAEAAEAIPCKETSVEVNSLMTIRPLGSRPWKRQTALEEKGWQNIINVRPLDFAII